MNYTRSNSRRSRSRPKNATRNPIGVEETKNYESPNNLHLNNSNSRYTPDDQTTEPDTLLSKGEETKESEPLHFNTISNRMSRLYSYSRKKLGNSARYSGKLYKNAGFMFYTPRERYNFETRKENEKIFQEAKRQIYESYKKNGDLNKTIIEMFLTNPKLVLQYFQYGGTYLFNSSSLGEYFEKDLPDLYLDVYALRHYSRNIIDYSNVDWKSLRRDNPKERWQLEQLMLATIRGKEINIYEKYIKKVNELNQRKTNKSSANVVYKRKVKQQGTVGKTIANSIQSYL
jgi:hypothetical protein